MNRGGGVGEEEASPVDHAIRGAHCAHHTEHESAIHRVKSFGNVNEHSGSMAMRGSKSRGEEGGEVEIVLNSTTRQVGALLGTKSWAHGSAKTSGQDLTENAVEGGCESDGAVGSRRGRVDGSGFEEGSDGASIKARGEGFKSANGSEQVCKEWCPAVPSNTPERVGDAVKARGGRGGAGGKGSLHLLNCNDRRASSSSEISREGVGKAIPEISKNSGKDLVLRVGVRDRSCTNGSIVVGEAVSDGGVGGEGGAIRGSKERNEGRQGGGGQERGDKGGGLLSLRKPSSPGCAHGRNGTGSGSVETCPCVQRGGESGSHSSGGASSSEGVHGRGKRLLHSKDGGSGVGAVPSVLCVQGTGMGSVGGEESGPPGEEFHMGESQAICYGTRGPVREASSRRRMGWEGGGKSMAAWSQGVEGSGRMEVNEDSMMVTTGTVEDMGGSNEGGQRGGEEDTVKAGKMGASVEGEGAGSGMAMPEGINSVREERGQECMSCQIRCSGGGGAGMAVDGRCGGEVEVAKHTRRGEVESVAKVIRDEGGTGSGASARPVCVNESERMTRPRDAKSLEAASGGRSRGSDRDGWGGANKDESAIVFMQESRIVSPE